MNSFDELDAPVARYFTHALGPKRAVSRGTRLRMHGRIKAPVWLSFRADWEGDGRSFDWRAVAGPGSLLRVRDRFAAGTGSMDIRLLGRIPVVHTEDEDTARSAAGRAALEAALWAPAALLPGQGVAWRAESEERVVASWSIPPERPEVHIQIDERGAVKSSWAMRWNNGSEGEPGYVPFGCDVLGDRTFGELTIASRVSAGWWYGTPRYEPFFEAEIDTASAF